MTDVHREVARIHAESIAQGFLSSLGVRFLALLYRAIDEAGNSALIVAREEGRVVGFAAGTLGIGEVYRAMLRRPLPLAAALAPSLLVPRRAFRLLETALYGRKQGGADAGPPAELLSIAVDARHRGGRHAENLYRGLEGFFREQGAPRFRIVVGEALGRAHRFYAKMGAKPAGTVEVHQGEKSVIYVQEVGR